MIKNYLKDIDENSMLVITEITEKSAKDYVLVNLNISYDANKLTISGIDDLEGYKKFEFEFNNITDIKCDINLEFGFKMIHYIFDIM